MVMKPRMIESLVAAVLVTAVAIVAAPQARPQGPTASAPQASSSIIGSVVDAMLTPIAGARVVLERQGRTAMTATTDAAGIFRFERVSPGDYRVRASHDGFTALVRDVTVPAGSASVRLPLVLVRPSDRLGGAGQSNVQMDGISPTASGGRAGALGAPTPVPPRCRNPST
jgi:hypothetical protein